MKTYKIKSFFYFLLFAAAAFFYNNIEQEDKFQEKIASTEITETADIDQVEGEDLDELETNKP